MPSRTQADRRCPAPVALACVAVLVVLSATAALAQTKASHANAVSAAPARLSGALLGLVTDAAGHPEAAAVVQVRSTGLHSRVVHALTSAQGLFSLQDLAPGVYYVEVGKGSQVAARRQIEVKATQRTLLLVSLPQLLGSARLGAPPGAKPDEAFNWALRQATVWRPVLRLDDAGSAPKQRAALESQPVQGFVGLSAGGGNGAFDAPAFSTNFRVDTALWDQALLSFTGAVGTNGQGGGGDTRVQADFRSPDAGNYNRLSLGVRQVSVQGLPALPSLRVLSLNYSDGLDVGSRVHLQFGTIMNAVSLSDTATEVDPYLRAIFHVGKEGQMEYRAVTAAPPVHFGPDAGDEAELADPTPTATLSHGRARLERAHHQEIQYSESLTPNDTVTAAVFDEHFSRAAVDGAFSLGGASLSANEVAGFSGGELLPDLLNNLFIADGGSYGGWGYRFVFEHRLGENWRADLGFADGSVLAPMPGKGGAFATNLASGLGGERAHAVTAKIEGVLPVTATQLICSYRALSRPAATGLDLYDDSPAQSESFLNIALQQPLPHLLSGGNRIQALVEIHNLLAQGYIPMLGSDGHTLYLVQSARSLRGGFTIHF